MKLFLSVIALAFATPALAQPAPADQHADHAHHATTTAAPASSACTTQHAAIGHCKAGEGAQEQAAQSHDRECCKKGADGKMPCCDKPRARKDCCKEDGRAPASTQPSHSGH